MYKLKFKIKSISALVLPIRAGDINMVSTRSYINGSVILGVFAYGYIKSFNLKDPVKNKEEFNDIFINGGLIFSNAYPEVGGKMAIPTPLSFYAKKHESDGNVYDMLFADEENIAQAGGYTVIDVEGDTISPVNVEKSINFHFAAGKNKDEAKTIFNYESIKENQSFFGFIYGENINYIEKIKSLFGKEKNLIRIGKSKSAQYGIAELAFEAIEEVEKGPFPANISGEKVVMTFLSDTIIYNEFGYSVVDIKTLGKTIKINIDKSYIRKNINDNFMSVWKLRKPSEQCFLAGSTFLLERLPDNYSEMESKGIGERTNEGFGRVKFDLKKNSSYNRIKLENEMERSRPAKVPALSRDILINYIKNKIRENIILKSFKDGNTVKGLQSGSLIKKIIGFAKDIDNFPKNIQNLRATSKDKLKSTKFKDDYLFDFLENRDNLEEEIKKDVDVKDKAGALKKITGEIKYFAEQDEQFLKQLKQFYIENFFTQIYRNRKKEK